MNALSRPVFALLFVGVGAIVGWLLRGLGAKSAEPQMIVSMTPAAAGGTTAPPAGRAEALQRLMLQIAQSSSDSPTPEFFDLVRKIEPCPPGELRSLLEKFFADSAKLSREAEKSGADFSEDGATAVAGTILIRLIEIDPATASEVILANEEHLAPLDCGAWVFAALARSSRGALPPLLEKLKNEDLRSAGQSAWISHLASADPAGAVKAVNAWRSAASPIAADAPHAEEIGRVWAKKDPAAAADGCLAFAEEPDRTAALDAVLDFWLRTDPAAARQWAEGQTGARAGQALSRLLANDPQAATRAAELASRFPELKDPGEGHSNYAPLAREIAARLADPDKSLAFIDALPAGEARDAATAALAARWVERDAAGASAWIARLPDGPAKNRGIESLVASVHESEPEGAFAWAQKHTEENVRLSLLTTILQEWLATNESAAQAALAGLPPDVASQLRERLERRRTPPRIE